MDKIHRQRHPLMEHVGGMDRVEFPLPLVMNKAYQLHCCARAISWSFVKGRNVAPAFVSNRASCSAPAGSGMGVARDMTSTDDRMGT